MKILNILLLLFITVSHTLAEEKESPTNLKEYDVEIIIFEDAHARYLNSQTWGDSTDTSKPITDSTETNDLPENLDKLSISEINATSFKPIKPAILNKEYKRINNSSEYEVLFYGAWRQAGLEDKKAFEININELNNKHKTKSENTMTGNFRLVLARYLHIYNQLNYERKTNVSEFDMAATNPVVNGKQTEVLNDSIIPNNETYPMNSHRRMRSKELHYIDHPLVGILIQINPVETTE